MLEEASRGVARSQLLVFNTTNPPHLNNPLGECCLWQIPSKKELINASTCVACCLSQKLHEVIET